MTRRPPVAAVTDAGEDGVWTALVTADGSRTLRHPGHGEALHSAAGAWTEAWERYVLGCRIPARLAAEPGRELAVLDVGTGMGLNLAALLCAAAAGRGRVRVTTLERSTAPILRAAELREEEERAGEGTAGPADLARRWLRPVHAALLAALRAHPPASSDPHPPRGTDAAAPGCGSIPENPPWVPLAGLGSLRLLLGDARATLAALPRRRELDAVFLDPFSPAVEPELWSPSFLREVAVRMAPGAWLATYSAATAVRAALLAAGLRVGSGGRVGAKADGSLASPDREPPPFAARVTRRIARRAAELEAGG